MCCVHGFKLISWEVSGNRTMGAVSTRITTRGCPYPTRIARLMFCHFRRPLLRVGLGPDAAIRAENANLRADNERLLKQADRTRKKRRRETRKAARAKKSNNMGGCQEVTVAEMAPRVTGLEGVQLVSEVDSAEPALGGVGAAIKKRCHVKGEVAQDKLIVELNGGKAIRRATSGKKLGGLEWKDSVMLGAVANWALNSLSFKAAGKTANAGLRIQGVRFWFKAEPLRSRRRACAKAFLQWSWPKTTVFMTRWSKPMQ